MKSSLGLSGTALGAVVGLGVALAAFVGWQVFGPIPKPQPQEALAQAQPLTPAPKPEGAAPLPTAAAPVAAPQTAPEIALPDVPRFDTFRLSDDGTAIVAGVGKGAQQVQVLLDGQNIGQSKPDSNGRFASVLNILPSDSPRLLSLLSKGEEGVEVPSEETILVAARAAQPDVPAAPAVAQPEPVARAEPVDPAPAQPVDAADMASASAPAEEELSAEAIEVSAPILVSHKGARKLGVISDGTLAIDTISYSSTGGVEIAGRGRAEYNLRIYLDNSAKAEVSIDAAGQWQTQLADVAPGLYTLRADQLDGAGKVSARAETPFLREVPKAPEDTAPSTARVEAVTVQPGYTLWGIAKDTYGDGLRYVQVFEANRQQIRNPDLIYPGQIFNLPASE